MSPLLQPIDLKWTQTPPRITRECLICNSRTLPSVACILFINCIWLYGPVLNNVDSFLYPIASVEVACCVYSGHMSQLLNLDNNSFTNYPLDYFLLREKSKFIG